MVDVVDSIVAELIVRDVDKYEAGFNRATKAHERFLASTGKLQRQTFDLGAEGRKYKAGVDGMARAEEQASQKVTRSRKARADTVVAQDEREVRSAKSAAKSKADAEIAEAARSARLRKAVETGVANSRVRQGSGAGFGATVPREGLGMAPSSGAGMAGAAAAQVGAEKEVNHLLADQATLQARLTSARGKDRDIIKEQLAEMRLIGQLQRAGLNDEQIALRLDQRRLLVERERSRSLKSSFLAGASGTGRGGKFGGVGSLGSIGSALGVGVAAAAIQSALDYGKALSNLSDQLGITVEDLQAYQKMARDAGVSQEQLTSAFGQFANNLGRAKQGEQDQVKIFKALGVNIRDFTTAGDALPTIINRISQIKDPAQRAAVETRLFGESGRRLDALLSGGAERVSALAASLQETGQALSAQEIKDLDETARKLAAVKAELQVDFARVVAGNADAINSFAGSFLTLSSQIIGAIQKLREFDLEMRKNGGITGLGLGQTQGDRDAAGAELRRIRLRTPAGRTRLRVENNAALDKELGVDTFLPGSDINKRRAFLLGQVKKGTPQYAEVQRLLGERGDIRRIERGVAAPTPTAPVQVGTVNNRALSNLGTPAGPKGPSAEQLAKQADQRQRRYEDELGRAQDDLLQAQRDLTGSAERRYEIDVQMENTALARRKLEIQREANEKQIDASRVKELQDAEAVASAERLKVLALEKAVRIESDANALRQQMLDAEVDALSAQEQLADSTSERREIAARRLAAERRAETASLNAIINSTDPNVSAGDRALARDRLGSQDARFGARAAQDARTNESPLAAYRRGLNRTPGQVTDAVEGYVVDELDAVHDAITGAIQKKLGIKDPLLSGLLDLFIDQLVMKPLLNALDKAKGEGGGGLGGLIQGVASFFGGTSGARAGGGNVVGGNSYLVGEHGPEVVAFGASGRVFPNGALPSIGRGGGGTTVIAPQHFDLSGVVMTEALVRQLDTRNRAYADAVAARAGRAAVAAAPGRMQRLQDLGS